VSVKTAAGGNRGHVGTTPAHVHNGFRWINSCRWSSFAFGDSACGRQTALPHAAHHELLLCTLPNTIDVKIVGQKFFGRATQRRSSIAQRTDGERSLRVPDTRPT
jgi:hypothetical protein